MNKNKSNLLFFFLYWVVNTPYIIGQTTTLENLDSLENKVFNSVEKALLHKEKVHHLHIWKQTNFDSRIFELKNLQSLKISHSQLSIPKEVNTLNSLKQLAFKWCTIKAIPLEITELNNLESLHFSFNETTNVSPILQQIGQLKKLKTLTLVDCNLQKIPKELEELPHLEELHLLRNPIGKSKQDSINLSNLKRLDLSYCSLQQLPPVVLKLKSLEELNLTINQLEEIPIEISQLENLKRIWFGGNPVTRVPKETALAIKKGSEKLEMISFRGLKLDWKQKKQLKRVFKDKGEIFPKMNDEWN